MMPEEWNGAPVRVLAEPKKLRYTHGDNQNAQQQKRKRLPVDEGVYNSESRQGHVLCGHPGFSAAGNQPPMVG